MWLNRLRGRKLAISLATTALALTGTEAALRVILHLRGTPYDAREPREKIAAIRSRAEGELPLPGNFAGPRKRHMGDVVHPYLGWDAKGSLDQLAAELRKARAPDPRDFRVLILGGSVAGIFRHTVSERFGDLLAADELLAGRRVELTSFARGAYKQPQQLLNLNYLLSLGIRPHAVLNIDGFNEVAIGNANGQQSIHPTYPSYPQWVPLVLDVGSRSDLLEGYWELRERRKALRSAATVAGRAPVYWSAGLGHLAWHWVYGREQAYTRATRDFLGVMSQAPLSPELLGPPDDRARLDAVSISVDCWFESSLLMFRICHSRGIPYLHVLQPTLHDPGAKRISAEEERVGRASDAWLSGVREGYPMMRERAAELRERGVAFLDASRIFAEVEETLYYDACHFGEQGNLSFAEVIAPALLAAIAERR